MARIEVTAIPNGTETKAHRKGWSKRQQVAHNKAKICKLVREGRTYADAARSCGLSPAIIKYYKRSDPEFSQNLQFAMHNRDGKDQAEKDANRPDIPFEEFAKTYLHHQLFWHQLQWLDVIEGREPRDLHSTQEWHAGDRNLIVINTPPFHAKSSTITMDYVTYRICMDRGIRVMIISKNQDMAKKFLRGIKARLTSNQYRQLIQDFAPSEGFDKGNAEWTATHIYVNGADVAQEGRGVEKDPTVEAVGLGGHIYGARADIIIIDDGVTLDNVAQVESQIEWIEQEVDSRIEPDTGLLIVVGTRVAPIDLYTELINPNRFPEEVSPWTRLTQPMVLEFSDDPKDWTTLWPRSNQPGRGDKDSKPDQDNLFRMWDGVRAAQIRRKKSPRTWGMVYMQQQIDEDQVFSQEDVMGCVDSMRMPGYLFNAREGGGLDKGEDWKIICGLDPATVAGYTAIVVLGVNTRTRKRKVVKVYNERMTPAVMNKTIKMVTEKFNVDEWRVEANAFQKYMTQNPELFKYMASRGVLWHEHQTQRNKWDEEFGVSAMAMLFQGWQTGDNLISLPSKTDEATRQMIEQLVTWAPDLPDGHKTDIVMALWFASIRAAELTSVLIDGDMFFGDSEFRTLEDENARAVVDVDQFLVNQQFQPVGLWSRGVNYETVDGEFS